MSGGGSFIYLKPLLGFVENLFFNDCRDAVFHNIPVESVFAEIFAIHQDVANRIVGERDFVRL